MDSAVLITTSVYEGDEENYTECLFIFQAWTEIPVYTVLTLDSSTGEHSGISFSSDENSCKLPVLHAFVT